MRNLLLFLFSPLCLFAVTCTIQNGENYNGEVVIHCVGDSGGGSNNQTNVLSVADCEELKDDVIGVLNRAEGDVRSAADTLMDIYNDQLGDLIMRAIDIQHEAEAITPPTLHSTNIIVMSVQLESRLDSLADDLVTKAQVLYGDADDIAALSRQVDSYVCNDQHCGSSGSGGGSVTCPCQEEFNRVLSSLGTIHEQLGQIELNTWSNNLICASIAAQLTIMSDSLTSITNRLNAPDDRMWGELESIYHNMHSNLYEVAHSTLNLQQIFYSIRQLIRGEGEGGKLNLTTEGVIALVNSAINMARNSQDQYSISAFDDAVKYFSNTVSTLFLNYNFLTMSSASVVVPSVTQYDFISQSMTNLNLAARNRYARFINRSSGNVTNWFQRMELYQQAALGWFDDNSPLSFEQNQDRTTESEMEYSFEQTTNTLGSISTGASNVFNNVSSLYSPIVGDLASVQIISSLPTQIVFIPEIETGMGTLPSLYLDCGEISEYCDVARKATTLIWKVAIWAMYIAVSVGLARLLFILVLYVIHFVQNL